MEFKDYSGKAFPNILGDFEGVPLLLKKDTQNKDSQIALQSKSGEFGYLQMESLIKKEKNLCFFPISPLLRKRKNPSPPTFPLDTDITKYFQANSVNGNFK